LAAAATLAAGHQARAEVVFTPSNLQFTGSRINIDLDNDGKFDFIMQTAFDGCGSQSHSCFEYWGVTGASGNAVVGNRKESALVRGNHIGRPNDIFGGLYMEGNSSGRYYGSWLNVTERYLGVRLIIDGEVHYGWIGFAKTIGDPGFKAKFSGWAYETEPNTPIRAGQRIGTADTPMALDSENVTALELRAAGHSGQAALRQRGH
jgi:hypothetical protein